MKEITLEANSNEEIWSLFDHNIDIIFIHGFSLNESSEWYTIDLKTERGLEFKNQSVRQLEMDVQTDLNGLKKILQQNTRQLRIYQFEKPVPSSLILEHLPDKNRNQILKQNGLKHFFFVNFEFVTIESFDPEFIDAIKSNPIFEKRIIE